MLGGALSLAILIFSSLIFVPALFLIGLVGAGFLCVLLYRHRTGQRLTVAHGAHLGWICGLFVFTIVIVLFAANILSDPASFPAALDAVREQLKASAVPGVDVNRVVEIMRSPTGILFELLFAFLLLTALPAFGGAIGAKLLDRD